MKAKYGIVDDDMYNFDESGFLIGKISLQLVVTGIDKPGKAKKLQPSDREWTTLYKASARQGALSHPSLSLPARFSSLTGSLRTSHATGSFK